MSYVISDLSIDAVCGSPAGGADALKSDHARAKNFGILQITTTEGLEGNCIVGEFWGRPEEYFAPIINVLKGELIGRCATEREWFWDRHNQLHRRFRSVDPAWEAIDIALWDFAGKAAALTVYKLLGAQRHAVPAYATYAAESNKAEQFVAEAEHTLAEGFTAYKIHLGETETCETCQAVALVRKRVGDDVALMMDPNCGYDFRKALEVGSAMDDAGFHWFEDPISHLDIDVMIELSRCLKTPLYMTDQAPQQFFSSTHFIRQQAVRLVCGTTLRLGITGLKKLCSLAEGFGLNCEVGTGSNPLTNAANLHVIQSVNNCDYFEYMYLREIERFGMSSYLEQDGAGTVSVPDKPGLGLDLDQTCRN